MVYWQMNQRGWISQSWYWAKAARNLHAAWALECKHSESLLIKSQNMGYIAEIGAATTGEGSGVVTRVFNSWSKIIKSMESCN